MDLSCKRNTTFDVAEADVLYQERVSCLPICDIAAAPRVLERGGGTVLLQYYRMVVPKRSCSAAVVAVLRCASRSRFRTSLGL